jgi:glycine/D-amino acid oxidase-like deaminating enzyme
MRTVLEPAQEIPVLLDADIVVVGGGTTGPLAAIAAARQGCRVVLIERFGSLGGNLTLGLNTKPTGIFSGGLPKELWDLARREGAAGEDYVATLRVGHAKVASTCDPEMMKLLLVRLCTEAGVQLLFETVVSRPLVSEGTVRGVIVENKGGRLFVGARVVIDCSADGDIAAKAGAPFLMGNGGEAPAMQPVSMYFTMKTVDLPVLAAWARAHRDAVPEYSIPDDEAGLAYSLWMTGFADMLKDFKARHGIPLTREHVTLKTADGVMFVNATRVTGVNGLSPLEASAAIVECYRQIDAYVRFLRECVPGFERSSLGQVAPVLGVRETRHIQGEYVLSREDVVSGRGFSDSIAADASHMDIHAVQGGGVDFRGLDPYEIPYRCLVPLGVEQLLVAGRCISVDHVAHGRTRNMPACMATGQAAGLAAAVAIQSNATVRQLDVGRVQRLLEKADMPLHVGQITEGRITAGPPRA